MHVTALLDKNITNETKEELLQLEAVCFGVGIERVKNDRRTDHFAPTFQHVIGYEDGKIIAYLRLIKRSITWQEKKILLGGVGSVCTHPYFRGKNYASKLLIHAMDILKEEGVDFALLQTNVEKGAKLYGEVGFVPVNKACMYINSENKYEQIKAKDVMMVPVKNRQLMQEVISSEAPFYIGEGDW